MLRVHARFKDNIWEQDLDGMRSLSCKNKIVKYLLYVIDVFIKYAWVKSLKDKKRKTALNAFMKIVNESNRQPNRSWVNQEREIYNKLMQEWLDNNNIVMHLTHNEGKSVITQRLKAKIYKNDN